MPNVVNLGQKQDGAREGCDPLDTPLTSDLDGGSVAAHKNTKSPAFQFYASDFIGSSKVQRMPLAERGAYITLLAFAWLDHGLPTDMGELGRMVGLTKSAFTKMWGSQLHKCFVERSGKFVNLRQEDIRKAQAEYRKRQRENAAKGWQSRGNAVASERHMPDGMPDVCSPTPSPTPSPSLPPVKTHTRGAGVQAGTTPRDHLKHTFCGQTFRVCVPEFLHGELVRRLGGDDAEARMRAFYVEVEAALDATKPVPEAVRFWRDAFALRFTPPTPMPARGTVREPQWAIDARAALAKGGAA